MIKDILKKGVVHRLRVSSDNVVQNYINNKKIKNSYEKTIKYWKQYNNCILVLIKEINIKLLNDHLIWLVAI